MKTTSWSLLLILLRIHSVFSSDCSSVCFTNPDPSKMVSGSTQDIQWFTGFFSDPSTSIKIDLYSGNWQSSVNDCHNPPQGSILSISTTNSGKASLSLPNGLGGSDYFIRVMGSGVCYLGPERGFSIQPNPSLVSSSSSSSSSPSSSSSSSSSSSPGGQSNERNGVSTGGAPFNSNGLPNSETGTNPNIGKGIGNSNSPSPSPNSAPNSNSDEKSLSVGAILGIIFGSLIFLVFIAGGATLLAQRHRRNSNPIIENGTVKPEALSDIGHESIGGIGDRSTVGTFAANSTQQPALLMSPVYNSQPTFNSLGLPPPLDSYLLALPTNSSAGIDESNSASNSAPSSLESSSKTGPSVSDTSIISPITLLALGGGVAALASQSSRSSSSTAPRTSSPNPHSILSPSYSTSRSEPLGPSLDSSSNSLVSSVLPPPLFPHENRNLSRADLIETDPMGITTDILALTLKGNSQTGNSPSKRVQDTLSDEDLSEEELPHAKKKGKVVSFQVSPSLPPSSTSTSPMIGESRDDSDELQPLSQHSSLSHPISTNLPSPAMLIQSPFPTPPKSPSSQSIPRSGDENFPMEPSQQLSKSQNSALPPSAQLSNLAIVKSQETETFQRIIPRTLFSPIESNVNQVSPTSLDSPNSPHLSTDQIPKPRTPTNLKTHSDWKPTSPPSSTHSNSNANTNIVLSPLASSSLLSRDEAELIAQAFRQELQKPSKKERSPEDGSLNTSTLERNLSGSTDFSSVV